MLDERLVALLRATGQAKSVAASLYNAWRDRAPTVESRLAVARLAEDEADHAAAILRMIDPTSGAASRLDAAPAVGCGLGDDTWPSALMAAFALDQAITAALVSLSQMPDEFLARAAAAIVEDERPHQAFALGTFRALADRDPALGRRVAREMIEARDWVQQVYPRRQALTDLVAAGVLPPEAPRAHDSFLASLGDRIQDALGVLGE